MANERKDTAIYIAYDDHVAFDPARPEKDLLRAILMNALSDLKKPGELSRRAREYILSPEDDYVFSFASICNHLELDTKTVRFVAGLVAELDADGAPERAKNGLLTVPEPSPTGGR